MAPPSEILNNEIMAARILVNAKFANKNLQPLNTTFVSINTPMVQQEVSLQRSTVRCLPPPTPSPTPPYTTDPKAYTAPQLNKNRTCYYHSQANFHIMNPYCANCIYCGHEYKNQIVRLANEVSNNANNYASTLWNYKSTLNRIVAANAQDLAESEELYNNFNNLSYQVKGHLLTIAATSSSITNIESSVNKLREISSDKESNNPITPPLEEQTQIVIHEPNAQKESAQIQTFHYSEPQENLVQKKQIVQLSMPVPTQSPQTLQTETKTKESLKPKKGRPILLKKRAKEPRKSKINVKVSKCSHCQSHSTPEWRRGPGGVRSLCNACGLFYSKLVKKFGTTDANTIFLSRKESDKLIDRTIPTTLQSNAILQKQLRLIRK